MKCDCHLHEQQVCDVCQGVGVTPDVEEKAYPRDYAAGMVTGTKMGMDWAILMIRNGNLRIGASFESELGVHPRDKPIHPWKITKLAWRSWWREKRGKVW